MGAVKFFVCGLLLAAACKKADGGIYQHNPFLNQVTVANPIVVQPAPALVTSEAVKPSIQQAVQLGGQNHAAHPLNQTHQVPTLTVQVPQIQASYPQIHANYPQIPSIFPQIVSYPQSFGVLHQPATLSTHKPIPPVIPTQPSIVPTHPPVRVEPQTIPQYVGGLRRLCLRTRGQFSSGRCNTFVNCWDDIAVEQTCPPGLAFNPAGYCDYLSNVDCQGRLFVEVPVPQPQPELPTPPNVQPQVVFEPDNQVPPLWVGSPQPPVITTTQQPTYVPPQPIQPVLPEVVPSVTYIPAGSVPDARLQSKCLRLRGQFPSDLCNRYIDCWDGLAAEKECPPGLYFSEKGYCDYDYNVNCQNRTAIKNSPPTNPYCPLPDGTFRDKRDCSHYFTCISNSVVGLYQCPEGLYFNDMIGVCDYANRVDCSREPFVYQPTKKTDLLQKVPAVLMDSSVDCRPGRVFRLNPDCTSAALCRSGGTEVIHCPAGMGYDAPSDKCLPLQLARCQDN